MLKVQDVDADVVFDYILPACARISSVLGADFVPFLPFVMEPLLRGAAQEVHFNMVDADEDDAEGEVVRFIFYSSNDIFNSPQTHNLTTKIIYLVL